MPTFTYTRMLRLRAVWQWLAVFGLVVSLLAATAAQAPGVAHAEPPTKECDGKEHEPNDQLVHGGGCNIELGERIHGSLADDTPTVTDPPEPLLDRDWFEFAWPQTETWYLAEVQPDAGADVWLSIQRPSGEQVAYSDSGGPGQREAVYFKTEGGGVPKMPAARSDFFVVGVGANAPTQGGYVLRITRADPPTPAPTSTPGGPPPPPQPTSTPQPPPPGATSTPGAQPTTWPPRATPTPGGQSGKLAWRLIGPAHPAAALVTTVHVLVYYDVNDSHGPEPGEGVAGLSVRAISRGQFVGWGITNAQGEADLVVVGPVDRVIVPFLNLQHDVRVGTSQDVVFRLEAVRLPTFLPVEGE